MASRHGHALAQKAELERGREDDFLAADADIVPLLDGLCADGADGRSAHYLRPGPDEHLPGKFRADRFPEIGKDRGEPDGLRA